MSLKITLPEIIILEIKRINGQVIQRRITKQFFRKYVNVRNRKIKPVLKIVKLKEYGWPIKELDKFIISEDEEDEDIFEKC